MWCPGSGVVLNCVDSYLFILSYFSFTLKSVDIKTITVMCLKVYRKNCNLHFKNKRYSPYMTFYLWPSNLIILTDKVLLSDVSFCSFEMIHR